MPAPAAIAPLHAPPLFPASGVDRALPVSGGLAGPVTGPLGLSVAFGAHPLDATPGWTRLDAGITGLGVNKVSIKRGRPTERDQTGVGTMTAVAIDTVGVLDPTNSGSAFVNQLDPIKQIAYALQNPVTSTWSTLFRGFIDDWNHDLTGLDKSASFDRVEIACSDAFEIIGGAEVVPDQAGNTVPGESVGSVYYDPVTITSDRVLAAIADTATTLNPYGGDWPAALLEIFTGNVKLKAGVYSSQTALLQVILDAANAEFPGVANFFVAKDGKLTFHGRFARFNPTDPDYHIATWKVGDTAAFSADSTVAVISDLQFTRGAANLINAAIATPKGIKDADIAGQFVSDAASVSKYGARSISFPDLLTDGHSDGSTTDLQETKLFPTYYVDNYKDPRSRISQIVVRSQPTTSAYGPNVWALLCGIDISDIVHVKTTHPGGGGFNEDFYVEGITYEIVPMTATSPDVTLTLDVSPKAYYDTDPFS